MTLDEFVSEFRIRFDDNVSPYQVAEDNLIIWANEAQIEACRRARLLSDSSLTVAVTAGTASYGVPETTILIRRGKLALDDCNLSFMGTGDLDEDVAGWESHTGTPTTLITDSDHGKLTLYPEPLVSDTLNLVVIREPDAIVNTGSSFEIPARFHYGLIDWLLYRAYQVRDADIESRSKSNEHYALFEQEFGGRSSAKDEIFNNRQRPYGNSDGYY